MPQRTCGVDGCAKPHRARGLCVTHYNHAHQPGRHRAQPTPCVICGTEVVRPPRADRRHVCSVQCRTVVEFGHTVGLDPYDWAKAAAQRAKLSGATIIEPIERLAIFERDGWNCGICHQPVDRQAPPFHPDSPTIDHVLPLSQGGQHTTDNVQCAHLRCNSAKQDNIGHTE